jgi:protein tyrosine phosphatase (PTP) superfamily phosphohydrolase (DUF442 family)
MKRTIAIIAASLILANPAVASELDSKRPTSWAQPLKLDGVPNLHKVSDNLYRSAQPTAQGMKNLKQMGIETVVNLRSFHSDRDEIGNTGLGYEHIYMKAWHPERKEAVRFLKIVTNQKRTPVLVHCLHGADRTGTMCALYRIAVQGWTKEEAIREMTEGGFNFHAVFDNLSEWIQKLDVESIKKDAGIPISTEPVAGWDRAGRAIFGDFFFLKPFGGKYGFLDYAPDPSTFSLNVNDYSNGD